MKHLKQQASSFFRTIWKSLTDIRFYRGIRHKKPGEAVGYLAVLVSMFWLAPFLVMFFIGAHEGLKLVLGGVDLNVPAGTVFEIKKGVMTNNLESPIVVRKGGLVMIVNTSTSTMALDAKDLGFVVDQNFITARSDAKTETLPLAKFQDFRVSKEDALGHVRSGAPLAITLIALFLLSLFAVATAFFLAISTVFYAFVLWLLMRIFKRPVTYREAWVLSAYAATVLVIAKTIMALIGQPEGGLPSALYWVMLGFVAFDLWKGGASDERPKETGTDDGVGSGASSA